MWESFLAFLNYAESVMPPTDFCFETLELLDVHIQLDEYVPFDILVAFAQSCIGG